MDPCWALLELLGHRQRAGWLSEEEIAGAGFLRLDVPQEGDPPMRTEYYGTAAVYAIHPSDEETVRKFNEPKKYASACLPIIEVNADPFADMTFDPDEGEEEEDREPGDCPRCAGCGQLANDAEQTPWKYWLEIPVGSAAAIITGIVQPFPCPDCKGSGKATWVVIASGTATDGGSFE